MVHIVSHRNRPTCTKCFVRIKHTLMIRSRFTGLFFPDSKTHPAISCMTFQYRTGLFGESDAVATAAEEDDLFVVLSQDEAMVVEIDILLHSRKHTSVKQIFESVNIVRKHSKSSHDH